MCFLVITTEEQSRRLLAACEHEAFESKLDLFCALARSIVARHSVESYGTRLDATACALRDEREECAAVRVALEAERAARHSVERSAIRAVDLSEHWRMRASQLAQELRDVREAHVAARDAALFWKARCVCATSALRHVTGDWFDYAAA